MAESLENREANQAMMEEIHNTLVAASTKMAQLQLEVIDDGKTADVVGDAMNDVSPIIESIDGLTQSYRMETNRMQNEGELD